MAETTTTAAGSVTDAATEPRAAPFDADTCGEVGACAEPGSALHRVFTLLGKRWTGLLVAALMSGPGHFTELRRVVHGISERMLSDRLTELAELGLVTREVEPGPPLRVNYRLTQAGQDLRPALLELTRWAETHLPEEGKNCPEEFRG